MKTVYLSNSNRCNPNVVMAVRAAIEAAGCTVAEYTGGDYSAAPMMAADAIVVVGETREPFVGRGLYDQVNLALRDNPDKFRNKIFFLTTETKDTLIVKLVDSVSRYDSDDWKSKYGLLHFPTPAFELMLSEELKHLKPNAPAAPAPVIPPKPASGEKGTLKDIEF